MRKPPEFKKGNKSFIKALKALSSFAWQHGVNAYGVPGWKEGKHGWRPPIIPSSVITPDPWDILASETGENFMLNLGTVLQDGGDLQTEITLSGEFTDFTPVAGQVLYIEVTETSPTSGTIAMAAPWTEYPEPYTTSGTGDTLALTHYRFPLWRFYTADGDGERRQFGEDLYGLQLCNYHLATINAAYKPDGEPILPVPVFNISPRAVPAS